MNHDFFYVMWTIKCVCYFAEDKMHYWIKQSQLWIHIQTNYWPQKDWDASSLMPANHPGSGGRLRPATLNAACGWRIDFFLSCAFLLCTFGLTLAHQSSLLLKEVTFQHKSSTQAQECLLFLSSLFTILLNCSCFLVLNLPQILLAFGRHCTATWVKARHLFYPPTPTPTPCFYPSSLHNTFLGHKLICALRICMYGNV